LKFDFGTRDAEISYYRLVVNKYYPVGHNSAFGYFKSGRNTGCYTNYFDGIGCGNLGGD
jgi:hypothetical protein